MRVFVAGASGAIGRRLVPQLIDAGHEVIGTHHSPASAELLRHARREAGHARPARRGRGAQGRARARARGDRAPGDRAGEREVRPQHGQGVRHDQRLRTTGTDALLAAAREAGVRRFVAQSFAAFPVRPRGRAGQDRGRSARPDPPPNTPQSAAAMAHLEQAVTDFGGIALRYGVFYGAANDGLIEPVRKRQFPIVGDGGGICSWIHLDDAAAATVLALEHDGAGDLQRRRRRARAGARVAAGARAGAGREAAAALPGLARAAARRRGRGRDVAPRRAARRTRRPSASSAGRRAIPAGGTGFPAAYSAIGMAERGQAQPATPTTRSAR